MDKSYLTGNKIYLRAVEKEDTKNITQIFNEKSNRILGDDDVPYPNSYEEVETFNQKNDSGKNFVICKKEGSKIIGTLAIYSISYQNMNCEIGITISEEFQGNGYGREAMEIIIDFIFMYLPMNKIKLQVFSFNPKAIKLYESLGFKHEGTLKEEIFRFAKFQDLENYSLLRNDWGNSYLTIR